MEGSRFNNERTVEEGSVDIEAALCRDIVTIKQKINVIFESLNPVDWHRGLVGFVAEIEENNNFCEQTQEFLGRLIPDIKNILDQERKIDFTDEDEALLGEKRAKRTILVIHKLALAIEKTLRIENQEKVEVKFVSMVELLKRDNFQVVTKKAKEIKIDLGFDSEREMKVMQMRLNAESDWVDFCPLVDEEILYKGGVSRTALKLLVGCPAHLLEPEFPLTDVDIVIRSDPDDGFEKGLPYVGDDLRGMEFFPEDDGMSACITSFDFSINEALFSTEGLYFTAAAKEAAQSGSIHPHSNSHRYLYDIDAMTRGLDTFSTSQQLSRAIKFLAEGKVANFIMPESNKNFDINDYLIYLARKFSQHENRGEMLNKIYFLAKQMGQTREGEENIYDVLKRIYQEKGYDFANNNSQNPKNIVRWLLKRHLFPNLQQKLINHYVKEEQDHELPRERQVVISLSDYQQDPALDVQTGKQWEAFVTSCEELKRSTT